MNIDLTIIIPVYNVEKYVGRTFNSILVQGNYLYRCEVIVVNDGTQDNSMTIVNSYIDKIPNLQVVNQDNQGLSCARNIGLKLAKGDYVWFVDSDDTITEDAIDSIMKAIPIKADMIGFSVNKVDEKTGHYSLEKCIVKDSYMSLYYKTNPGVFLHRKIHNGMVQRFVFSRTFLLRNKMEFYPGIYFEDDEFIIRAQMKAYKILLLPQIIYNYLVRSNGSIMSEIREKHIKDKIIVVNNLLNYCELEAKSLQEKAMMKDAVFTHVYWALSNTSRVKCNNYSTIELGKTRIIGLIAAIESMPYYYGISKIKKLFRTLLRLY